MKIVIRGFVAAGMLCASMSAFAQTPLNVATPTLPMLRTGTPVALKTSAMITTKDKKAKIGDRIPMEVAEAVRLNGQVVIPAGTPAMAELTEVRNKGMWGKSGHVTARVLYLRVGDRQVRLSGNFDDKGVTGTAGVVAAIALIPVAGFFTTGTSAEIPAGSSVSAFLDEDVPVAGAPVESAPLVAATPAPAIVPAVATQTISATAPTPTSMQR